MFYSLSRLDLLNRLNLVNKRRLRTTVTKSLNKWRTENPQKYVDFHIPKIWQNLKHYFTTSHFIKHVPFIFEECHHVRLSARKYSTLRQKNSAIICQYGSEETTTGTLFWKNDTKNILKYYSATTTKLIIPS